ncbi:sialin isoform X2 [Apis dorsata]|uniref:sialin isoform X2 n=1 Tax=Apis dorsata TaxID=7462 RepID=UPI0003DF7067|nr:sialin isoform X2 [Apis dorsata]
MAERREFFTCRDVLWYLVFCGFAINYMLRLNLHLTIVSMVIPPETPGNNGVTTPSNISILKYEDRFAWNENEQNLALGSYFWLHWTTQIPGGFLARNYGTKIVFGMGNLLPAIIGFIIPIATYQLYILVILRILQGFFAGVVWPSMHNMTAKWIPPNERSRFVSSYLGGSVGAAITYPLCAIIIRGLNWGATFHITSLIGVIWYCFWYFFAFDTPQQHPRISDEEKKYILDSIADSVDEEVKKVPWKSILTSIPVWVVIISQTGGGWALFTLLTHVPTYFSVIHGWNITMTGIISGAPHLLRMVFSYYYSVFSDWLITNKKMSVTNTRKLAVFVSLGMQGIFVCLLSFCGYYPVLAAIFMTSGVAVNGALSAGTLATLVDLSPNFASINLGFSGMIVLSLAFVPPIVTGLLTVDKQTVLQWQKVFLISGGASVLGTIVFLIFGTAEEQPWNKYAQWLCDVS